MTTDDTKDPSRNREGAPPDDPLEILRMGLEKAAAAGSEETVQPPAQEARPEQSLPETSKRQNPRKFLMSFFLGLILLAGAVAVAWQFYGEQLQKTAWVSMLTGKTGQRDASQQAKVYYCPMHKEYESDKPGNCPICSMKLVKMEKPATGAPAQGDVYYCPMHKDYQSDKPGNCPICSMKLVKKETGAAQAGKPKGESSSMPGMTMPDHAGSAPMAESANTIFVSPQQQQLIGVHMAAATLRPLVKEIRTVGKIAYDETKVTHIHTKISGWIEQVFVDFVGKFVKKGDPLFTIYSPDLVSTQEEYLLALRAQKELANGSFERVSNSARNLVEATRRRLRLWDVTDEEIARLEKEGRARRDLTIFSPVSGLVTERAAYHHGRYVTPEMDLYTIVDLSTVWALGEIYEYELPLVRQGQRAVVEMPYEEATRPISGTVTYIYPYLNPTTRTAQIRMEFANPKYQLKPDMFVNVKLRIDLGRQLTVPEDAVLDTGTQQYVFVDKGSGYFEPREVKLGGQAEGFYAIKQGLKPGEKVVTAANFILDSESRLKGAFANMGQPQQGMPATGKATKQLQIQLRTEPDPAKVGDNTVRVKVADAGGSPVGDASVQVKISMPAMGSMPPMSSEARLSAQGNGEYSGVLNVPMAWTWQTMVTVERGGQLLGSAQFRITAR